MRRRTRTVILVGVAAVWGLPALLEEAEVLGWTDCGGDVLPKGRDRAERARAGGGSRGGDV